MERSWIMKRHVAGLAFALAACNQTQISEATTLAELASNQSKTVTKVVADGQLFCQSQAVQVGEALMPVISAIVNATTGLPVSVIGMTGTAVSDICSKINAIPVALSSAADPSKVQVVKIN